MDKSFKQGFFKFAKEKEDLPEMDAFDPSLGLKDEGPSLAQGAAAGTGAVGVKAVSDSIGSMIKEYHEGKGQVQTVKALEKKLKPGDIIFTRAGNSPELEIGEGKKSVRLPFPEKYPLQSGVGSTKYHAALYLGNGQVYHAPGEGRALKESLKDIVKGYEASVYRPTGASKREITEALKTPKRLRYSMYKTEKDLAKQGLTNLLMPGGGPKSCRKAPNGRVVCTTVITHAYPKQFEKQFTNIDEMRKTKGMKLVGGYSNIPKAKGVEKAMAYIGHPVLKNLKWLAPAAAVGAAGAWATKKLMGKNKEIKATKDMTKQKVQASKLIKKKEPI